MLKYRNKMALFRSIRFNIYVGLAIAIAAAVGTLVPQTPESPANVETFQLHHPALSHFYHFLGFFDLYHSPWFMGLLALMAFDIVLCKLWNRPPDPDVVSLPPEETKEAEAEKHLSMKAEALRLKPLKAVLVAKTPYREAAAKAREMLRARGYHLREEFSLPQGSAFLATRHRPQRWGSYTTHIALVVILLGALIKGVWGFTEMIPVLEGSSRAVQNIPQWAVHVDHFRVRYYPGTMNPSSYESDVRLTDGGKLLAAKTIHVNDPLDYQGVRFYQASWGAGGMFRKVLLEIGGKAMELAQRRAEAIPGLPFRVEADMMLPDFTITPDGRPDTASLEPKNPAVRFAFFLGKNKTRALWLFMNFPKVCLVEDEDGRLSHAPPPPFRLAGIEPILFSGIQTAYDPGYKVVAAGGILWLCGTVLLFYLHRRRLWVLVEPRRKGSKEEMESSPIRLSVGGFGSRGPKAYAAEFDSIIRAFETELSGHAEIQESRNNIQEVV